MLRISTQDTDNLVHYHTIINTNIVSWINQYPLA